jgi:hypothetical protein
MEHQEIFLDNGYMALVDFVNEGDTYQPQIRILKFRAFDQDDCEIVSPSLLKELEEEAIDDIFEFIAERDRLARDPEYGYN